MRKLALILAAASALGFSVPASASDASQSAPFKVARADVVKVKTVHRGHGVRTVVVRKRVVHRNAPRYGARKVIVVKKHRPQRTVVRKVIIHR